MNKEKIYKEKEFGLVNMFPVILRGRRMFFSKINFGGLL